MSHEFLISDYIIQVADGTMCRLLSGFETRSEITSASDGVPQGPICSIRRCGGTVTHGVESMSPSHPIRHVMGLSRESSAVIMADDNFVQISVRSNTRDGLLEGMLLGVYSRLTYYRTVFVHGALIEVPNYGGIMFIGSSGVGKTTQAALWNMFRGADIINGDKVFLGLRDSHPGEVLAYGSPWRGSSEYCLNRRVPLRAVIVLKRLAEKGIRPLNDMEALVNFAHALYMPGWGEQLTGLVTETMGDILERISLYEMSCDVNEDAVCMVEEALGFAR